MATFCHKCGKEIPEGAPVCRFCYAPVRREGFLTRLFRAFSIIGRVSAGKSLPVAGAMVKIELSEPIKMRDPLTGEMREYHSLDEAPEEVRQQIMEQIRKAAPAAMAALKNGDVMAEMDAGGNVQTYHSVEDLSPDDRALYDEAGGQDSSK